MVITSKENKTAKLISGLKAKKHRDETGLFVVEGIRAVNDVLAYAPELTVALVTDEKHASEYENATVFSENLMRNVSETENSQGVIAVLRKPASTASNSGNALFLDGIRDPGNLGTLIRTACAAGFKDIYLYRCADEFSGKVVRSTMSAIVKVNLIHADVSVPAQLKNIGYTVIGADMHGENIFTFAPESEKVCIVVGGEANGISEEIRLQCDDTVSVPMSEDIESLNAAISGAIMMYEINRKEYTSQK